MNLGRSRWKAGVSAVVILASALTFVTIIGSEESEASELVRFSDCDAVRSYLDESSGTATAQKSAANAGSTGAGRDASASTSSAEADAPSALSDRTAAPSAPSPSGQDSGGTALAESSASGSTGTTNVQVEGVDELDVVDTDGRLLLVVDEGSGSRILEQAATPAATLRLLDPAGAGSVLDTEALPGYSHQLTWDPAAGVAWLVSNDYSTDGSGSITRVTRVKVSDGKLELDGSADVRGSLVGARRTGGRLHLVATDGGGLVAYTTTGSAASGVAVDAVPPSGGATPETQPRLPFEGGDVQVPCDQVWHPIAPSDPSALLVATFDPADPATDGNLVAADVVEVAGAGQYLYGTTEALYVATTLYEEEGTSTSVHRFRLDGLGLTGSGRVPGVPLSQFSFDEHEGNLRVATTVDSNSGRRILVTDDFGDTGGITADGREPAIAPDEPAPDGPAPVEEPQIDNVVTVLDTDGDLDERGRLGGLGKPGERIQGVRFSGDTGYVVTFQQTDPFYVIDLSNPDQPQTAGELELPGFSAYLHPIDDGLVIGIGQAGTEEGTLLGAQAQLFDVSDPRAPRLVDQEPLGDDTPAANDHHAFTVLADGEFAVPSIDYPDAQDLPFSIDPGVIDDIAVPRPAVAPDAAVAPDTPVAGGTSGLPAQPQTTPAQPAQPVEILPPTEPVPLPEPFPVPTFAQPTTLVVAIRADDGGLERVREFRLTPPDQAGGFFATSYLIRTVPVAGRIAVVDGSYGVALFNPDGTGLSWVLFEG